MRGAVIRLGIAVAALIGAFLGAVAILNTTIYSPAGYVQTYVDALVRKDPGAALGLAGPLPSSSALDDLLTEDVMPDLEVTEITELKSTGSRHRVEVRAVVAGQPTTAEFELEETGSILGLFPQWGFARTPLVQLDLQVLHASEFTANGVRRVAPAPNAARTYLAFTPGAITFGHESTLLTAPDRAVVFGSPTRPVAVTINPLPNDTFTEAVRSQAHAFLDACAEQQVLYPVGCPFGQDLADRLASPPSWTILAYPPTTLLPTTTLGEWTVPVGEGVAEVDAEVRSIYDGSVTPFTAAVEYRIGYVVTLVGEEIIVTPRLG
ncbi:MAG TPA: hypothetical protein VNQ48_06575 [Microbacteriaceae bacterium]|nr:hypothetical protein [Microbacteriaceae bacterium]